MSFVLYDAGLTEFSLNLQSAIFLSVAAGRPVLTHRESSRSPAAARPGSQHNCDEHIARFNAAVDDRCAPVIKRA
jgi:hypothetical protein